MSVVRHTCKMRNEIVYITGCFCNNIIIVWLTCVHTWMEGSWVSFSSFLFFCECAVHTYYYFSVRT